MSSTLVKELLEFAGLPIEGLRAESLGGGQTNTTQLVHSASGKHVARIYQWPHDSAELERPVKEKYLHSLLRGRGVPVPAVLASIDREGEAALLLEYVEGDLLGDIGPLDDGDEWSAWSTSGQALRAAHEIEFPQTHGVIEGESVRAVLDSFGSWQIANIIHHVKELNTKFDRQLPVDTIEALLDGSLDTLNAVQNRLLHNDPHPWNILIDGQRDYQCSAWLDWEYAFVGDPNWDLVRMDVWRMQPLPTHEAFWEGYGKPADEPNRSVYEMSIYLWQAHAELSGEECGPTHTRKEALRYLDAFPTALARLMALVPNQA